MRTSGARKRNINWLENVRSVDDWAYMAQWSDVIIFDLLIVSNDRLKHFQVRPH